MTTQREYQRYLVQLAQRVPLEDATLADVLEFVADGTTPAVRRQRSRSCRAFYRWAHGEGVMEADWWQRVPSLNEPATPQATVTVDDVATTLAAIRGQTFAAARDRALIAVLWSSGLRRSEVARMRVEDLDVEQRCVMVIGAKGGKPRLAPLSPEAARYLLRYLRHRAVHPHAASPALWLGERGPVADQGIRQVLERRGAPSAHAFRRGWCVDSLRTGVSQTSVQAAAGWAGPAMVSRYSSTLRDRPGGHDRADRATAGLTPDAQPPPAFRSVVLGGRPGRGCPDSAVAGSSASPSQSAAGPGRSVTP